MRAGRQRPRQDGFTYLGVLFLVTLMALGLAGTGETWAVASRRAREREMIWVGNQYARALQAYYVQSPGARQYPSRLEELIYDTRFPEPRHHLRQMYQDPISRSPWGTVIDAQGRIAGVRSQSDERPLKQANFPAKWAEFKGLTRYSDWQFVADSARQQAANPAAAGAPGAPGAAGATATPAAPGATG